MGKFKQNYLTIISVLVMNHPKNIYQLKVNIFNIIIFKVDILLNFQFLINLK